MADIDRATFTEMVKLLTPLVNTENSQNELIQNALMDAPGLQAQIAIGGPGRTFATLMLRKTMDYGTLPDGTLAVVAVLQTLIDLDMVGGKGKDEVEVLIAKINGEPVPDVTPPPSSEAPAPNSDRVDLPAQSVDIVEEHIFISFSSVERFAFVEPYIKRLSDAGYKVWVDNMGTENRLRAGQEWEPQLANAIAKAAAINVLLSPDSLQSKWVHAEVRRARELGKPIFPVIVREIKDDTSQAAYKQMGISRIQAINLARYGYEAAIKQLLEDLEHEGIPKLESE